MIHTFELDFPLPPAGMSQAKWPALMLLIDAKDPNWKLYS